MSEPHDVDPRARTESLTRKRVIPEWIWQTAVGACLGLAVWTHGKMIGYEVALAQHTVRLDRTETLIDKIDSKFEKVDAKIERLLELFQPRSNK